MEARLKEREATLTDSNKEKDTTITTLKEQVSQDVYVHIHVMKNANFLR